MATPGPVLVACSLGGYTWASACSMLSRSGGFQTVGPGPQGGLRPGPGGPQAIEADFLGEGGGRIS